MVTPAAVQQVRISAAHRRAAIDEILEAERARIAGLLADYTDGEIIIAVNHHVDGGWPAFIQTRDDVRRLAQALAHPEASA